MKEIQTMVIVGAQWGDEGKGKLVDAFSESSDYVTRFQGGHNAGHTLVIDGITYKLSIMPSGIVRNNVRSIIGNGCVIDYRHFQKEFETLVEKGVKINPDKLLVSEDASLILPLHVEKDKQQEQVNNIGTTKKGIGPAYEDKIGRRALKIADLFLGEKHIKNKLIGLYENAGYELVKKILYEDVLKELLEFKKFIEPYVATTWKVLNDEIKQGKKVLFEGAQGVLLDIDHGTYPYVTSSNTVSSSASSGTGVGMNKIDHVIGVAKAYTTRVGNGEFPTELFDDIGEHICQKGHEYGTVTGRKRRCGWLDLPALKKAIDIAGIDSLSLMKIDVLDELDEIKICTKYLVDGQEKDFLSTVDKNKNITPVYEVFPGWKQSTEGIKDFDSLPENAKKYIQYIEKAVQTPIVVVSTSPKREDVIIRDVKFEHFFSNDTSGLKI